MKKYFRCEICGCEVPNECEGAEPNTCAECMPLDTEKMGQIKRNRYEMDKFPREAETPPKTAQNEPKIVVKYKTKHLQCFLSKDQWGKKHYQIFEKGDINKPVLIYVDPHTPLKISNELPKNIHEYKYFLELGEIVEFLVNLDNAV